MMLRWNLLLLLLLSLAGCAPRAGRPTLGIMENRGVQSSTLQVEVTQEMLVELVPPPPADCAETTGCAFSQGACVTYAVGRDGRIIVTVSHAKPPSCTTRGWQHYSRPGTD